eukprot:6196418-Pleurochrysis_carterae.AAC.2
MNSFSQLMLSLFIAMCLEAVISWIAGTLSGRSSMSFGFTIALRQWYEQWRVSFSGSKIA